MNMLFFKMAFVVNAVFTGRREVLVFGIVLVVGLKDLFVSVRWCWRPLVPVKHSAQRAVQWLVGRAVASSNESSVYNSLPVNMPATTCKRNASHCSNCLD